MLKKLFTFLVLSMFLIIGSTYAQVPPNPTLGPNEHWTNLWSVQYDYQTNGTVRYLVQDPTTPTNLCAILMATQDSNAALGASRYIYFAYSDDAGNTWSANSVTENAPHGFPCLSLSDGIPIIAAHETPATIGTKVWKDVVFGGFSLSLVTGIQPLAGPQQPIWPHITGTTNGNIVIAAAPNDASTFPGHRATYSGSWSPYVELPGINGPSGNFDACSGPNGKVAIIGYDYVNDINLKYFESSDNGVTFDGGTVIAPYIIDGSDTLYFNIQGAYQGVYDASGNLHIVCVAYNQFDLDPVVENTTRFVKPRIYHWTQAGGFNIVAGSNNIPTLTDTLTQALTAPLSQPTIARMEDGKLVCAFTTYLWGNKQQVDNGAFVNAGEIFYSSSANNGATWSTPENLTNTPLIEEKHPSLAQYWSGSTNLGIYYIRDLKAGGWVNFAAWGKAPVYGIYKTFTPVGIRENVSLAKTYEMFQNYPNPFNPSTTISYYIQKTGFVSLKIYDMIGKEVATVVNEIQTQGAKEISFDGSKLSSGVYYYTISAGDFKDTKKMMLIK